MEKFSLFNLINALAESIDESNEAGNNKQDDGQTTDKQTSGGQSSPDNTPPIEQAQPAKSHKISYADSFLERHNAIAARVSKGKKQ